MYFGGVLHRAPLSYAKEMLERQPLMALAGSHPQELLAALDDLEEVADIYEQNDPEHAELIRASYPLASMRALAQLESDRQTFLQTGTEENLSAYTTQLHEALTLYIQDVRMFRDAFSEAVSDDAMYATERELVSKQDVLHALVMLEDAARATQLTEERREQCLSGLTLWCRTSDVALAPMPDPVTLPTAEELAVAHSIQEGYGLAGPLVSINSSCLRDGKSGIFSGTQYVGDIRLVESSKHTNVPFYKYFADHGITYVPNNPITYYTCPNLMSDWGLLGAPVEDLIAQIVVIENHHLSNPDPELKKALAVNLQTHFFPRTPFLVYFFAPALLPNQDFFTTTPSREDEPYVWYSDLPEQRTEILRDAQAYQATHI